MKSFKLVSVIVLLTVLFSFVPPFVVLAAPAVPAPLPLPSRFQQPTQDAVWYCDEIWQAGNICPTPREMSPFTGSVSIAGNLYGSWATGHIVCPESEPTCWQNFDVYYWVSYRFTWSVYEGHASTPQYGVNIRHVGEQWFACESGLSGSCSGVVQGIIHAENINDNIFSVSTSASGLDSPNGWSYGFQFYFSLIPRGNCDEKYTQPSSSDPLIIDPVIETPLGPSGTPPDQQIYTTVQGHIYRIQASGGPWKDGTNDRTDTAISWDGETWVPLVDTDSLCSEQDPNTGQTQTVYITAESDTFYIRVNDTAGNFADNTNDPDPMTYTIGEAFENAPPCESQFTYDPGSDLLATVVVPGTSEDVPATTSMVVGEWYAIEVVSGTWQDEGVPPDRKDMEFKVDGDPNAQEDTTYHDLADGSYGVRCKSSTDDVWYIQAQNTNLGLRVNNETSDFINNTGSLNVNVYHAAFARALETCEFPFSTYGDPVHSSVDAAAVDGREFAYIAPEDDTPLSGTVGHRDMNDSSSSELVPGAFYILDTTDGPWSNNSQIGAGTLGDAHYDVAVNAEDDTWVPLKDWTLPACNVQLDALGHRRIYFQVPLSAFSWRLRVNDTGGDFAPNTGAMGWNLYRAVNNGSINPGIGHHNPWVPCTDAYQLQGGSEVLWIPVFREDGVYVDPAGVGWASVSPLVPSVPFPHGANTVLSVGDTFAVTISDGPWDPSIEAPADRYDAAISSDNGSTWYGFNDETNPAIVCSQPDQARIYWTVMFTVQDGQQWKIRVNDENGMFLDNAGSLGYRLYKVGPEKGDATTGSRPGNHPNDVRSGLCKLPAVLPVMNITLPTTPTEVISLDTLTYFKDLIVNVVSGTIYYVADWLDYISFAIRTFISWCPHNTEFILGLIDQISQYEPFATLKELDEVEANVLSDLKSYEWDHPVVDSSIFTVTGRSQIDKMIRERFFPSDHKAVDPWSEHAQLVNPANFNEGLPDYYYTCSTLLGDYAPTRLRESICFVNAYVRETGLSWVIQLALDLGALILVFGMAKETIQEVIYALTGVKPWTKSGFNASLTRVINYYGSSGEGGGGGDENAEFLSSKYGGRYERDSNGDYRRVG